MSFAHFRAASERDFLQAAGPGRRLARLLVCSLTAAAALLAGVKLQIEEGRPVADGVYVNGYGPFRFLVDTATTSNQIERGLARAIGLTAVYRTELATSVGTTVLPGRGGVVVELDQARADDQEFLFSDLAIVHRQISSRIQGILGQAFLSHFDYNLDLSRKRLDFGRQDVRGSRLPLRLTSGRVAVNTSLGDLVLDSGTTALVLFGIEPDRGGNADGYLRTIAGARFVGMVYRSLTLAGQRIWSGRAVAIPEQVEPGVAGLMPLSFFRAVYFCNSGKYAVFK